MQKTHLATYCTRTHASELYEGLSVKATVKTWMTHSAGSSREAGIEKTARLEGEGGGPEPPVGERASAGKAAARQANTRQANTQNTGSEAKAEQANRHTNMEHAWNQGKNVVVKVFACRRLPSHSPLMSLLMI